MTNFGHVLVYYVNKLEKQLNVSQCYDFTLSLHCWLQTAYEKLKQEGRA